MDFVNEVIIYAVNVTHLFSPLRLVETFTMSRAYESIMQVIKDKTDCKSGNNKTIDYYKAVRIAYIESEYMQKYLDKTIKDVKEINKTFKPIWEFTYKISGGEEERVKVVKRDPDNLLVSWILDERIHCE
jgi:capsular polysaccharide biosynthesis protein